MVICMDNNKLHVYDFLKKSFRDLDNNNYDNDLTLGVIFFERSALSVIKQEFHICGYVMINNSGNIFPIDIRNNEFAILEGTYNCLPTFIKSQLIKYNLNYRPKFIFSSFFLKQILLGEFKGYDNGSFLDLCTYILQNIDLIDTLINMDLNLIFPVTYDELCIFTQNIQKLLDINYLSPEYTDDANYVIDALINNYHVNMSMNDIELYCYQLSNIANNKWRK